MALFQRRPQVANPMLHYSVGSGRTLLLVGLGNPGKEYNGTRHNIGFDVLDFFVDKTEELGDWSTKKDLKCELVSGQLGTTKVICIKPTTFMNLSGEAVQAVMAFYKLSIDQVTVLHDELDIPFGQIRSRLDGSSAGHNGLKSIIGLQGEDFGRIRIGIGPKPARISAANFVLQRFNDDEQAQMKNLNKEISALLGEFIYGSALPQDTRSFLV